MNSGLLIFSLFGYAVVVLLLASLPEMSRPTVPLGVSVPSTRVKEPVISEAIARYRRWIFVGGAVGAVVIVALVNFPALGTVVTLLFLVWWALVFARCRRPIIEAKQREGWYNNVQVRVTASVTRKRSATPRWFLLTLALGMSLAALVAVVVAYDKLPQTIPTHYTVSGHADGWAHKSWITVLIPGLIGLGITTMFIALSVMLSRRHDAQLPDGAPNTARELQQNKNRMIQTVLAVTALLTALVMAGLALVPVVDVSALGMSVLLWCLLAASVLPTIWLTVQTARMQKRAKQSCEEPGPESPDDDHLWPWGLFYLNAGDPRAFVPKRSGVGLTVNVGHPVGMAFMGLTLLLTLGSVVLLITAAVVGG